MVRSVCSDSSRCSISQREDSTAVSVPWPMMSFQAPTIPYRRNALSSAATSRIAHLLTQAVIAVCIGNRGLGYLQVGFYPFRRRCRLEAIEHVLDMFGARIAGFQYQFHSNQDRFQPVLGHGSEHLGHNAITTFVPEQEPAQALQRFGHVGERGAVSKRPGLSLDQRDVMLPVVAGPVALEAARMTRHHSVVGGEIDALRVDPNADHLAYQLTRY